MTARAQSPIQTLWLCGALHAFTHVYQVALIPLYLLIQADLKLTSTGAAPLLVTVMGLAYFLPSYPMGILADRWSRKKLLTFGLALNALGFVGLAFAHSYAGALGCVIVAGCGGSFFHPSATALIARLFPLTTGRALGWVGVGASVGFFCGPLYSGWRAELSGSWRTPVLELGLLGFVGAGAFAFLAQEQPATANHTEPLNRPTAKLFGTAQLWLCFLAAAVAFSLRDFAGSGVGSLSSFFLQQAHHFSPRQTGLALSGIFLASAVSNPLFGRLSDRGRLRWTCLVLALAAALIALYPHLPVNWLLPVFVAYGFFFIANYPMVEAALMEAVPDAVRGRVFGLFITVGGLIGNLAHWLMGAWVKRLGATAGDVAAYHPIYHTLALLLLASLAGLPCLHALRRREAEATPTLTDRPPRNAAAASRSSA